MYQRAFDCLHGLLDFHDDEAAAQVLRFIGSAKPKALSARPDAGCFVLADVGFWFLGGAAELACFRAAVAIAACLDLFGRPVFGPTDIPVSDPVVRAAREAPVAD